ncbi:MAG: signal peptidase I [Candidatus Asgardarchaeia archaeon]
MSQLKVILDRLNAPPPKDEDVYYLLFKILLFFFLGMLTYYIALLPNYNSLGLILIDLTNADLIATFILSGLTSVVYTVLSTPLLYLLWKIYYRKAEYKMFSDFVVVIISYIFSLVIMLILGAIYMILYPQNISYYLSSFNVDLIRFLPVPVLGYLTYYVAIFLYEWLLLLIEKNETSKFADTLRKHESDLKTVFLGILLIASVFGVNFYLPSALNTTHPIVVVSSQSMVPNLNVGDIIILHGVPPSEIKVGDIIVFKATWLPENSPFVIHRVIKIEIKSGHYYFYTKGDHNLIRDPEPAPDTNVIGVAVVVIPKIGTVTLFLQYSGLAIPLAVFLVIILVYSFFSQDEDNK